MIRILRTSLIALALAAPAAAEEFQTVTDRSAFVQLVQGKKLTRTGIRLTVSPSGEIEGRAFGKPVTGDWRWNAGYFCRDLFFGGSSLGANCQSVKVRGTTVRFISDQGAGQYADLSLR